MSDQVLRFHFANIPVRGAIVRLQQSWQEVRASAKVTGLAESLLGEMLAASAVLASSLKPGASVAVQLQNHALLRLVFGECSADGLLRGVARLGEGDPPTRFSELGATALLGVTLETQVPPQRYQGLVGSAAESLAQALENYLQQSEQVPSRLLLASDGSIAAGLLLQRMPDLSARPDDDPDGWNRLGHLIDTLGSPELLSETPERLLHRLFHEERLVAEGARSLRFGCRCSPGKVADVLRMLGSEEVNATLRDAGEVRVTCEFCNRVYRFDAVDAAAVFADNLVELPQPRPN